ncbi:MAG: tetratricopeptide repeat protein [Proteobacteria bacterium]|nr:tetratricopeptide repeat protein [Pseudomonadota bacterium]MDA1012413.1 tetratricopeptide repeat protein [Pseudomonadota bacterium]
MNRLGTLLLLFFSSTCFAEVDDVDTARRACDAADGAVCYNLGVLYAEGKDVDYDFIKVIEYYGKGCDGGIATACDALGFAYYYGDGSEYYVKACDQGRANSCMKIGNAYERGIGVEQSDNQALKFFGLACDLKSEWGCDDYARLKRDLGR